jgi:hypothetical protein
MANANLIGKYYAASLEVQCREGKMEKDASHGKGGYESTGCW